MEDNLATFSDLTPLSDADKQLLETVCEEFHTQVRVPCTACRYCCDGCPVKINIPDLLVEMRSRVVEQERPNTESAALRAAQWVLSDPKRLAGAQKAANVAGRLIGDRTVRSVPGLGAWSDARDVPTPPTESFRQWWTRERGTNE